MVFSVGYGSRKLEEFLLLLQKNSISYLVDVRTQPYSKYNPDFSQNKLKEFLKSNGIMYVFMGDALGGRPLDISCYDDEGKVDYNKVMSKVFFKKGIDRIRTAYEKDLKIVLMCSEGKPCECHRSKLIGRALLDEGIVVIHIDENGRLKDQYTVINELNKGLPDTDLFGSSSSRTSRKTYI